MVNVNIKDHKIGEGERCFIIAEIAQAHDGSLGLAHAYIDTVAGTGVDAVKFQTHIADEESTDYEPWRVKFSYQDKKRIDYWRRMEFSPEQWIGLKKHADDKGLIFLSSPFSVKAVDLLEKCEVPMWKIASGEINNYILYERIAKSNKPVILSSGMSYLSDLDDSVKYFRNRNIQTMIMQCTTEYPCQPEKIGLNYVREYRDKYQCPTGLSDHSGEIFASLAAVTLGANLIEVHVTMSRDMFGPDVASSITIEELKQLTNGIRKIESMVTSDLDKNQITKEKEIYRTTFGKTLVASCTIKKGEIFTMEKLTAKKPLMGIPVSEVYQILGKSAAIDIEEGEFINYSQIGE